MYTVDYFIDKFSAIAEEKFTTKVFRDFDHTKRCSLGHCMPDEILDDIYDENRLVDGAVKFSQQEMDGPMREARELCFLFDKSSAKNGSGLIIDINNGDDPRYQQPTPKQRILAALYDIKKMQTKDIDTGGKVKTVYVAVSVSITDQAKELVLS